MNPIDIPCPTCGAKPGDQCIIVPTRKRDLHTLYFRNDPHVERKIDAALPRHLDTDYRKE